MKRDVDLAREIMAAIEASDSNRLHPAVALPGRSKEEISYHVKLLYEAGLIDATDLSSPSELHWVPGHLTWAGHEFLEMARRDTLWDRAKTRVREKTGGLSLDLLRDVLADLVRKELGL